jgi:hypothetical protein
MFTSCVKIKSSLSDRACVVELIRQTMCECIYLDFQFVRLILVRRKGSVSKKPGLWLKSQCSKPSTITTECRSSAGSTQQVFQKISGELWLKRSKHESDYLSRSNIEVNNPRSFNFTFAAPLYGMVLCPSEICLSIIILISLLL